jgi:hypothetical protein
MSWKKNPIERAMKAQIRITVARKKGDLHSPGGDVPAKRAALRELKKYYSVRTKNEKRTSRPVKS